MGLYATALSKVIIVLIELKFMLENQIKQKIFPW